MDRLIVVFGFIVVMQLLCNCVTNANFVLPVERKFKSPHNNLEAIKTHDALRHGRFLSAVDVPLGGDGRPNTNGLYYTKVGLGTPAKDYYLQVDTGSDTLWVNCVGCTSCHRTSGLGLNLTLYDPNDSETSHVVACDDDFCTSTYDGQISGCNKNMACPYSITYGDGSATSGSFIKDYITYNKVSGDLHLTPESCSVIFGCGSKQSGILTASNSEALDGIIGFGQSNTSVLSQLAAAGKVQKVFSHCLDSIMGGGIFSIGKVVEPKFNTTPMIPRMAHYNVVLREMEVDGEALELPTDFFDSGSGRGSIIDSGTTLAFLPASVYDQLMVKILAQQPELQTEIVEDQFICFKYYGKIDDGFPVVKFYFEGLSLTVYPHDYLFPYERKGLERFLDRYKWCIGWQKSTTQTKDGREMIILGDLVLSNKLVVYDLEDMTIGWTDYNCSLPIKVKDDNTGSVYEVNSKDLSSASTVFIGRILTFFLLLIAMLST